MAGYSDDMLALRTSYEGKLHDLRAANSELAARATQAEADLSAANERVAELEAALVPAYEGGVDHAFEAAKEAAAGELAAAQERERVMREALERIASRHIPDQPMAVDMPETDYVASQYGELRRIARAAIQPKEPANG